MSQTRLMVVLQIIIGYIFVQEGILKLVMPSYGVERFDQIGILFPKYVSLLVGMMEIICGSMLMFNLQIKKAIIPLLIIMIGALTLTKIPMFFSKGVAITLHEARLDFVLVTILTLLLFCRNKSSSKTY